MTRSLPSHQQARVITRPSGLCRPPAYKPQFHEIHSPHINPSFFEPRSRGFPKGLLDRAFYARVTGPSNLKARFNGLRLKGFGRDPGEAGFVSTLKRAGNYCAALTPSAKSAGLVTLRVSRPKTANFDHSVPEQN